MALETSSTNKAIVAPLSWEQLPRAVRESFLDKLPGLYGQPRASAAFGGLATDKQQALLLLERRFTELGLWPYLKQIENVYGLGGVGMNFSTWPGFKQILRQHRCFSRRWAKRYNTDGGFREKSVRFGGLHILYNGQSEQRRWDAHFDMYNPLFSVSNLARHVCNEVLRSRTPDWMMVRGWLAQQ